MRKKVEPDQEAERDRELGVEVDLVGEVDDPVGGKEKGLQAGLEKGVGRALEVDHLLAVGERVGAVGVGDPAAELVDDVDADEDADLAPEVAPTLGQLGGDAGESARHGTANCNPAVKRPLGSAR